MTIDLEFFYDGRIVLRVNMTASNFYGKVCADIPDENFDDAVIVEDEETGNEIFTDKPFVRRIWAGCLKHGHISEDHDILGLWVDKMILK